MQRTEQINWTTSSWINDQVHILCFTDMHIAFEFNEMYGLW